MVVRVDGIGPLSVTTRTRRSLSSFPTIDLPRSALLTVIPGVAASADDSSWAHPIAAAPQAPEGGDPSLPADYRWLYGYLDPVWLGNIKLNEFGIVSGRGSIGVGLNDFPVWQKREREHAVQTLGISHYEGALRSGLA